MAKQPDMMLTQDMLDEEQRCVRDAMSVVRDAIGSLKPGHAMSACLCVAAEMYQDLQDAAGAGCVGHEKAYASMAGTYYAQVEDYRRHGSIKRSCLSGT